jgi:hypothetical protein
VIEVAWAELCAVGVFRVVPSRHNLQAPAAETCKETNMSPPAGLKRQCHLQLLPWLLKLPELKPEPERPQIQNCRSMRTPLITSLMLLEVDRNLHQRRSKKAKSNLLNCSWNEWSRKRESTQLKRNRTTFQQASQATR